MNALHKTRVCSHIRDGSARVELWVFSRKYWSNPTSSKSSQVLLNLPETHNLDRIKGALSVSLIFPFVPHNSAVSLTSTRIPPTHHAILTEPSTVNDLRR